MSPARAPPKRKSGGKPKTQVLSTSEARAHFADALETAQLGNAVIGFDRYGRTVAALVPVEAVYMLAGLGRLVPAATRKEIQAGATQFARNVPYTPRQPAEKAKPSRKTRTKKSAKKSAGKKKRMRP